MKLSLLLGALLCGACGKGSAPLKPDLPASVASSWRLKSYDVSQPPAGLPSSGRPSVCWKANYAGTGAAEIWVCAYRAPGSAFDAEQRTPSAADTVKFSDGGYFVMARWNGGTRAEVTALIHAVQGAIRR